MSTTGWEYPTTITQQSHTKKLGASALDGEAQYAHPWSNSLNNLKKADNYTQCGIAGKTGCNITVAHGIAGYRNICPIAGPTGSYPFVPELYLGDFNLGIPSGSKITKIVVSFEHKVKGVDVGSGKIYTNWGPKFSDTACRVRFGNSEHKSGWTLKGTKLDTWVQSKYEKEFSSPPTSTLSDLEIDILFGPGKNTSDPGILYLKNVCVNVAYTPPSGLSLTKNSTTSGTILTSKSETCATEITQKVTVSPSSATLTPKLPSGCKKTSDNNSNPRIIKFRDLTGVAGTKNVVWTAKTSTETKTLNVPYTAKTVTSPSITFPTSLIKDYELLSGITVNSGFCPTIQGYIDTKKTSPDFTINEDGDIEELKEKILTLDCGTHTVYFYQGSTKIKEVTFTLKPLTFNFAFKLNNGTNEISECGSQSKTSSIKISHVSDSYTQYKIPPESVKIIKDTTYNAGTMPVNLNIGDNGVYTYPISCYKAGNHQVILEYSDSCTTHQVSYNFKIIATAPIKQRYDKLLLKAEDGTSFKYNSIVVMEGDGVKSKINSGEITKGFTFKDLDLKARCEKTKINDQGYVDIELTYIGSQKQINNLNLEMNLTKCEIPDDTTAECDCDEMENGFQEWNGIFNNLSEVFYEVNPDITSNVNIKNLSPDDDLIESEDVLLQYKTLEKDVPVFLRLPFMSRFPKILYMDFFINNVPLKFTDLTKQDNEGVPSDDC